jgi:CTP synthase
MVPDILCLRSAGPLQDGLIRKVSVSCGVPVQRIFQMNDVQHIYMVPLKMHEQGFLTAVATHLRLDHCSPQLARWEGYVDHLLTCEDTVKIALVGKYMTNDDTYLSVKRACLHASILFKRKLQLVTIDASLFDDVRITASGEVVQDQKRQGSPRQGNSSPGQQQQQQQQQRERFQDGLQTLLAADCIIVPGGFGFRGTNGMLRVIQYARESNTPFLGICLGFQLAVVEFCRNVLKMEHATSEELVKPENPFVDNQCAVVVIAPMSDYLSQQMGEY